MQNGYLIANLRSKYELSQTEFAKKLNISYALYKLFELEELPMSLEILNFTCNYFNVSLNYLLNLTNNPKSQNFQQEINYQYLRFCLVFIRKKNKFTQQALAKELKMSLTSLIRYENCISDIPITFLYTFAKKFNISLDYICGKSLKKEIL